MSDVILVIHVLIALSLIGVVLLQRSEGGGLGIGGGGGGGGGGMSGFLTGRGTANILTKTTAVLAAAFMATSITLSILAGAGRESRSIIDELPVTAPSGESSAPSEPAVPVE